MIQCQKCRQNNFQGSNFCRFCGFRFNLNQKQNFTEQKVNNFEQTPPRPYSWQTDEFQEKKDQTSRRTEQINRVRPIADRQPNVNTQKVSSPINYRQHQQMQMQPKYHNTLSTGYHCPFCNSNEMPVIVKKVSPTGWAVFTVLLISTFILFWIGLLIQEERRICPVCNMRVG